MKVAVIGGGYSGTIAAIHLGQQAKTTHISLYEPNQQALGVAYSTPFDYHWLNVPAGKMSAFADSPNHFVDWLEKNNLENERLRSQPLTQHFMPRKVYGAYLQSIFSEFHNQSQKLGLIQEQVRKIRPHPKGWLLDTHDQSNTYDHVVLATGNPKPNGLFNLKPSPTFIDNPWQWERIAQINPDDNILIIGTGLTMVDVALTLKHHNHRGPITALSRHGYLPRAHDLSQSPFTYNALSATPRTLIKQVRSLQQDNNWRSTIDGLRPHSQKLWQQFNTKQQAQFLRHVRAMWDVHRHRIAKPIADDIQSMCKNQLSVVAGRIQSIEQTDNAYQVQYQPRYSDSTKTLKPQIIINCVGPNANIEKNTDPFIQDLSQQGFIRACRLKLGIDVQANGQVISQQGSPTPKLWSLGPPTKGQFWEIIAVPDIRLQAMALANAL